MALLQMNGKWYQSTRTGQPRRVYPTFGKAFTTKKGKRGRYVYVNGRRVGFQEFKSRRRYS